MAIRGILLDFYGTVVHEDDVLIAEICAEISSAMAEPIEPRAVGSLWWQIFSRSFVASHGDGFRTQRDIEQASLEEVCRILNAACDVDAMCQRLFDFWQHPPLFDDAARFLSDVTVPVVVVSNIDRADIDAAIEAHRLVFDDVIASEDVRSYKPRPESYLAGLASLGMDPHEVLHIGDSTTSDVAGAAALGIPVAWVNRKGRASPTDPRPDHEVADLSELLDVAVL